MKMTLVFEGNRGPKVLPLKAGILAVKRAMVVAAHRRRIQYGLSARGTMDA
jgi:hypothetical protein